MIILPLALLLSPWAIRNALLHRQFVPLQVNSYAGYDWDEAYFAYRRFVSAWGGSAQWWDKRSAGCSFEPRPGYAWTFELPREAFAPGYGCAEVEAVRRLFLRPDSDPRRRGAARGAFERLTALYRKQRPFRYYVVAPIQLASQTVLHRGSYYLPVRWDSACYSSIQGLLKLTRSLMYHFTLVAGTGGLILGTVRRRLPLLFPGFPLLLLVLFGWVMCLPEIRYFDLAFPLLLVGTALLAGAVRALRSPGPAPSVPRAGSS